METLEYVRRREEITSNCVIQSLIICASNATRLGKFATKVDLKIELLSELFWKCYFLSKTFVAANLWATVEKLGHFLLSHLATLFVTYMCKEKQW